MVEIRGLTSEDFENEEFIRSLLEMEVVGYKTASELKAVFERRKPTTDTWVAVLDGKIVGVASLMIHHSFTGRNLAVPMDIYVSPEYRGRGIGRLLVKQTSVAVDRSRAWRIFGPVGRDLVPLYEEFFFERKDVLYMEYIVPEKSNELNEPKVFL